MYEPESDVAPWNFFNVDQIFSNNYYGNSTQYDVKISDEQYIRDSHCDSECCSINYEIYTHALQEELSQLSITEAPELSDYGEKSFQESTVDPSHRPLSNYYLDESELDGEVEKRLYQLNPVPHVPRINEDIPSVDEATTDHQRLLDRWPSDFSLGPEEVPGDSQKANLSWHTAHTVTGPRLQLYDLVEHKVLGDGNCQFRALSDQFYQMPEHHIFVRQQVVHQLRAHPEMYEGYVPMGYGEYLERMSRSGEWGDHVTLQAAADSYGVKVLVITSFEGTCYIEILPKDQKSKRVIYLSFWAEVHYDSIYPRGDQLPSDF